MPMLKRVTVFLAGLGMLAAVSAPCGLSSGQDDPAVRYAPILGDYEFDLSESGMGVIVIKVYIEDATLFAWPETSNEPAELMPVEADGFVFRIDDPDEGAYDVTFFKDESGQYTKCRVVNAGMGMDVTGDRIVK